MITLLASGHKKLDIYHKIATLKKVTRDLAQGVSSGRIEDVTKAKQQLGVLRVNLSDIEVLLEEYQSLYCLELEVELNLINNSNRIVKNIARPTEMASRSGPGISEVYISRDWEG